MSGFFSRAYSKACADIELYFASDAEKIGIAKRTLESEEKRITKQIEDIDDEAKWINKDIVAAGKKQDRDELKILAGNLVRQRRNRRELEKYRSYLDGMLAQVKTIQMQSLTNDVTGILLECVANMPNMSNHEERRNNMMEFQKQMASMKMSNEMLTDFLKEDEDDYEDDELSGEAKEIVDSALAGTSFALMDKLPSVSVVQPRNNNNNNNNNNSIKTSTNPSNILHEIDKYAKT